MLGAAGSHWEAYKLLPHYTGAGLSVSLILVQLNSDSMSLESIVGKDNLTRLEGAVGREKVERITGRFRVDPAC